MKRILAILGFLVGVCASAYAEEPTIDKGNQVSSYVVTVDSYSTNTVISMSVSVQGRHSDYIIKNGGLVNVWIGGDTPVTTTGTSEEYVLTPGESISVDGRCLANVYANTAAGTSTASKLYVFMSACKI